MKSLFSKLLPVLLLLCSAFTTTAYAFEIAQPAGNKPADGKRISANVTLDGILLSEYTYPLAYQKFNLRTQRFLQNFEIKIVMNGSEYFLNADDLSFEVNTIDLLNQLWFSNIEQGEGNGYTTVYTYDKAKAEEFADAVVEELKAKVPPVTKQGPAFNLQTRTYSNATAGGQIIGYDLDPSAFLNQIYNKIDYAIWTAADHHAELNIKSAPVYSKPEETSSAGYGRLSTFSTQTTNVPNRNTNIQLACKYLTGTRIKPGATFSFNGTLGFTSKDRGFLEAGILVNGQPDTGLGGGICQVSSTIYNAVLEAGLKVVERHPHSAPVGYVPAGRDATVSYGGPDFKFQNNTPNDLYLVCDYNNRTLTISLYGKK